MLNFLFAPRRVAAVVFAVTLSIVAGCGGGKGDVSGKVTYNGKALTFGNVQFLSPGGAFPAEIGPDGSYSVSGVPVGISKIAVTSRDEEGFIKYMKARSAAGKDKTAPMPKGNPEDYDKIPSKYGDTGQSGLTFEVKTGQQTFNIDLK